MKNGIPELNQTLAKELLQEGLRGNPRTMMGVSYGKMLELENQVRELVKDKTITLSNKQGYQKMLQDFIIHFKENNYGFNQERVNNANQLLNTLKSTSGNEIDAGTALWLRRFIDSIRNTKSFKADTLMAPKQEAFKSAADTLRNELSTQIGEMGQIMNKYRIYIQAFDSLADYAAKSENRALINLTDAIIGGGGLSSGYPGTGIGTMFMVRLFQQPWSRTGLGQILFKTGKVGEKVLRPGVSEYLSGKGLQEMMPDYFNK